MAHEHYAARAHPEFVVLDIGQDLGALIIHADPGLHGVEVEISPAGADDQRSHKEFLERRMAQRPAFTAVFDALPQGAYTLWLGDQPRARDVVIEGGKVSQLDWS
ncbi:MAG TPA: hypothetical protein VGY32_03270 [Solirubrobacteraceae bacterium]|jgi:hypothetical protein|nr:hypothetical protein [Solirubrobacteraceae bacterium]